MLALMLHAGPLRFALPARAVVHVVPRQPLQPVACAPDGVIGLLRFRRRLTPVVDLAELVLGRPAAALRSSRIVVLGVETPTGPRWFGLLAERVLDLCEYQTTEPGIRLPEQPWLAEHLVGHADAPQLIDPAQLLPERLAALFDEAV